MTTASNFNALTVFFLFKENGDLNQIENEEPQSAETIQEAKSVSPATTSSQSNGHSNGMDSM